MRVFEHYQDQQRKKAVEHNVRNVMKMKLTKSRAISPTANDINNRNILESFFDMNLHSDTPETFGIW